MEKPSVSELDPPNPEHRKIPDYCQKISTLSDIRLRKLIASYFLRNDVPKYIESSARDQERSIKIAQRMRGYKFVEPNEYGSAFNAKKILEWLRANEAARFTIAIGTLAEELYELLAEELGERAALESIDHCPHPDASRSMMHSAKSNCLSILEHLLIDEFEEPVTKSFIIAEQRLKTKRVMQ
jgi:hypothetical protein